MDLSYVALYEHDSRSQSPVNDNPWSKLKIFSPPLAEPLCSNIIPDDQYAVIASKGDIYIVSSPTECSNCKSWHDLCHLSTRGGTLTLIQTSGTKPQGLIDCIYASGMSSDGNCLVVFARNLDVFSLDLRNNQWTRLEIDGPAPPQRTGPSITVVGSKFFLFGGHTWSWVNELWVLDLGPSVFKPSWALVVPSTSEIPRPRAGHRCMPYKHHLILFGGYASSQFLNDIWFYNIETRTWSELQCTGSIPAPRSSHSLALINDAAYIFGGSAMLNDLWALDIPQRQWHSLNEEKNPKPRYHHSMVQVGKKLYVFGGPVDDKNVIDVLDTGFLSRPNLRQRMDTTQPQSDQEQPPPPPQYEDVGISSQDPSTLSFLVAKLKNNKPEAPISSVVNEETVDLMRMLLDMNSPISLASQLDEALDLEVLFEFILCLLDDGCLPKPTLLPDANRKARRLMIRMVAQYKWPLIPKAILLPETSIRKDSESQKKGSTDRLRGELQGRAVALRLLPATPHKNFYQELLTWRSLHHKHVLSILGIYILKSPRKVRYLVTPEMVNGTLSQWRKEQKPTVGEIQKLITQVARGVQYIHSEGIIHGNLRGSNILLDSDLNCKICNFGMIKSPDDASGVSSITLPNFAAPELFDDLADDGEPLDSDTEIHVAAKTEKSDVYAFACLYYEIHFDVIPFNDVQYDKRCPELLETPALRREAWKLMRQCWRSEPRLRPTMEIIVEEMAGWEDD